MQRSTVCRGVYLTLIILFGDRFIHSTIQLDPQDWSNLFGFIFVFLLKRMKKIMSWMFKLSELQQVLNSIVYRFLLYIVYRKFYQLKSERNIWKCISICKYNFCFVLLKNFSLISQYFKIFRFDISKVSYDVNNYWYHFIPNL